MVVVPHYTRNAVLEATQTGSYQEEDQVHADIHIPRYS